MGIRYEKQFAFQNVDDTYSAVSYQSIWGVSGVGNLFKPGTLTGVSPTYDQAHSASTYAIPGVPAPSIGVAYSRSRARRIPRDAFWLIAPAPPFFAPGTPYPPFVKA